MIQEEAQVKLMNSDLPYVEVPADGVTATRTTFVKRDGTQWSYPYSYIGLIEMTHPCHITIHGTCGTMESTIIQGQHLSELARLFDLQRLTHVSESHLGDPQQVGVVVETIRIQLPNKETDP